MNADGHWIEKIPGLSLGVMGYFAWIFRKNPHLQGLAAYQIASATMGWILWLVMKDEGIFDSTFAQSSEIIAIASHYILGILLVIGINKTGKNG